MFRIQRTANTTSRMPNATHHTTTPAIRPADTPSSVVDGSSSLVVRSSWVVVVVVEVVIVVVVGVKYWSLQRVPLLRQQYMSPLYSLQLFMRSPSQKPEVTS